MPTDYSLSPRSPQPFSQYNRIKLLEETEYSIGTSSLPGLEDVDPMKLLSASKSEVRKLRKESIVKMLDESPFKVNNKKRAHVKTHGKMGFLEMSKTMSKLWKNCDDETKSIFRQVSNEGKAKFQKNILDNYKAQAQRKPTLIPMLTTAQLPSFDFLKKACKMQAPPPLKSDAAAARFHKRTITPPEHGLQAASFSGMYAMALPQMMIPPLEAITLRQTPMPPEASPMVSKKDPVNLNSVAAAPLLADTMNNIQPVPLRHSFLNRITPGEESLSDFEFDEEVELLTSEEMHDMLKNVDWKEEKSEMTHKEQDNAMAARTN